MSVGQLPTKLPELHTSAEVTKELNDFVSSLHREHNTAEIMAQAHELRAKLFEKYNIPAEEQEALGHAQIEDMIHDAQFLQEFKAEQEKYIAAAAVACRDFQINVYEPITTKYKDIAESDSDDAMKSEALRSFAKDIFKSAWEGMRELRVYGIYVMNDPDVTHLFDHDIKEKATTFFGNMELLVIDGETDPTHLDEDVDYFLKSIRQDWPEVFVAIGDAILRMNDSEHISSYNLMDEK